MSDFDNTSKYYGRKILKTNLSMIGEEKADLETVKKVIQTKNIYNIKSQYFSLAFLAHLVNEKNRLPIKSIGVGKSLHIFCKSPLGYNTFGII